MVLLLFCFLLLSYVAVVIVPASAFVGVVDVVFVVVVVVAAVAVVT